MAGLAESKVQGLQSADYTVVDTVMAVALQELGQDSRASVFVAIVAAQEREQGIPRLAAAAVAVVVVVFGR